MEKKESKKKTMMNTSLVELFKKFLQECPEMEIVLKDSDMSTDQYLLFLSEILRLRKQQLSSGHTFQSMRGISSSCLKVVPGF